MINDPLFGRTNRHLYPMGTDADINSPIEQAKSRGPSDAPNVAGTPSETTIATPRQVPPMHPDYIPDIHLPQELYRYRKPSTGLVVPRYGVLYDSQRTRDGWDHYVDFEIEGTVTTAAGSVRTALASPNLLSLFNRVMMYPGATSYYICIRAFNAAPTTTTGTGVVTFQFIDANNNIVPLGVVSLANAVTQSNLSSIVPTPYTDPTNTAIGTLNATTTTGASFPVYVFQIAFSFIYLLPVQDDGGYIPLRDSENGQVTALSRREARDRS